MTWTWLIVAILPIALVAMPDDAWATGSMKTVAADETALPAGDLAALRKAAERGTTKDWVKFGNVFRDGRTREGRVVSRNHAEAVKWYRRAAEKGDALGQMALGSMLAAGRGAEQNELEALKWFIVSSTSSINWGAQVESDRLKAKLPQSSRLAAERLAKDWMAQHPRDPMKPDLD